MSATSRARVGLVEFLRTTRQTDTRTALHRGGPPADQSGERVASWTEKSLDTPDIPAGTFTGKRVPWKLSIRNDCLPQQLFTPAFIVAKQVLANRIRLRIFISVN